MSLSSAQQLEMNIMKTDNSFISPSAESLQGGGTEVFPCVAFY